MHKVQYRSKVSYHLSCLISRDKSLVSRDESLVSRDENLDSRDESLVSREPVKRIFWNKLQAIGFARKRLISCDANTARRGLELKLASLDSTLSLKTKILNGIGVMKKRSYMYRTYEKTSAKT